MLKYHVREASEQSQRTPASSQGSAKESFIRRARTGSPDRSQLSFKLCAFARYEKTSNTLLKLSRITYHVVTDAETAEVEVGIVAELSRGSKFWNIGHSTRI